MADPIVKLKNEDFRINPNAAADNALKIRKDVCKCGATICDYEVQLTDPVTAIALGGEYEGKEIYLPSEEYPATDEGAEALQADLREALQGIANVNVTHSGGTLTISIYNSLVVIASVNGGEVTPSNCSGTGSPTEVPNVDEEIEGGE